ncbi:MAG TPA: vitamin B12-dependent ribonucleotide reductase, partial [Polyangiaceae bacterium]
LLGAPHVNRASLKARGLADDDLAKIENALLGAFELDLAFGPWVLGEETYTRLGVPVERMRRPGFSLLSYLGFSRAEIDEANDVIIGRMTIEGAPHLRLEHYSVFDCANRCGKTGKRFLAPMSHVRMMAAAQPFLSGAISKTVNLPNDATVDEVRDIYEQGWRLGLKAVALYRDGCKASQPLSTSSKESSAGEAEVEETAAPERVAAKAVSSSTSAQVVPPTLPTGTRVRLPKKRHGFTQEAKVGGHKIFLRTGEYANGQLGEIFIDMHKEGAAFRSLMNCFAMAVSVGLQYGVPLDTFVEQFTFTRFEPQGTVEGHPNIKFATSIVDYLFRVLGVEYLHRYDFAQVPPTPAEQAAHPTERVMPALAESVRDAINQGTEMPERALPVHVARTELVDTTPERALPKAESASVPEMGASALDAQLEEMMGDAPVCDCCGHITVRNGACYKCLNCGNSMGCS